MEKYFCVWIGMQGGEETFLQTPLLPLRGYQHGHVDTPLPPLRGHPATPRRRSACVWGNVYLHVSRNTSASALSMRLGKWHGRADKHTHSQALCMRLGKWLITTCVRLHEKKRQFCRSENVSKGKKILMAKIR